MHLSLESRVVGRVTIVRCVGRIVAGSESESLREHVSFLMHDSRAIVLHMGEVAFIDSSGLGAMVRVLTITRQANGELKLCNVPEHVHKILAMTHLTKLFETHESEEKAVAAFYRPGARAAKAERTGRSVVCVDQNGDVLAYLREVLHRAGFDVQTVAHLRDAATLLRIMHPDLVLLGPDIPASAGAIEAFHAACARVPVIELDREFSTRHAGDAGAGLLEKIEARLNPRSN